MINLDYVQRDMERIASDLKYYLSTLGYIGNTGFLIHKCSRLMDSTDRTSIYVSPITLDQYHPSFRHESECNCVLFCDVKYDDSGNGSYVVYKDHQRKKIGEASGINALIEIMLSEDGKRKIKEAILEYGFTVGCW